MERRSALVTLQEAATATQASGEGHVPGLQLSNLFA